MAFGPAPCPSRDSMKGWGRVKGRWVFMAKYSAVPGASLLSSCTVPAMIFFSAGLCCPGFCLEGEDGPCVEQVPVLSRSCSWRPQHLLLPQSREWPKTKLNLCAPAGCCKHRPLPPISPSSHLRLGDIPAKGHPWLSRSPDLKVSPQLRQFHFCFR